MVLQWLQASKAAVTSLFDTLRTEFGSDIGITIVTPGLIESEMTEPELISEVCQLGLLLLLHLTCLNSLFFPTFGMIFTGSNVFYTGWVNWNVCQGNCERGVSRRKVCDRAILDWSIVCGEASLPWSGWIFQPLAFNQSTNVLKEKCLVTACYYWIAEWRKLSWENSDVCFLDIFCTRVSQVKTYARRYSLNGYISYYSEVIWYDIHLR